MKEVYILIKESYLYWDNDYNVSYKVFANKQSAMNYFTIEKESLLAEAMGELNVTTVEQIQNLYDEEDSVYSFSNTDDYYHIDIEEWGYDLLKIEKQDIMNFNI